jgi:hypothetical protein
MHVTTDAQVNIVEIDGTNLSLTSRKAVAAFEGAQGIDKFFLA